MRYLATVEQFFVVLRRRGLMLSAADVALVERWRDAGIPVETVCRALANGAEYYRASRGADARLPDSLRFYTRFVEELLELARSEPSTSPPPVRSAVEARPAVDGAHEPPTASSETPEEQPDAGASGPLAELAWLGRAETDPRRRQAYRAAWRAMRDAGDLRDESVRARVLADADRAAVDELLRLLKPAERAELDSAVAAKLDRERDHLGLHGARVRGRAILEDELALRYGLVRLREEIA